MLLFEQVTAEAKNEHPAKGGQAGVQFSVEGLPTVMIAEGDAVRTSARVEGRHRGYVFFISISAGQSCSLHFSILCSFGDIGCKKEGSVGAGAAPIYIPSMDIKERDRGRWSSVGRSVLQAWRFSFIVRSLFVFKTLKDT